ncbi:hypothetical protein SUNI508_13983 [Seiridium unicorne]|uniref:Uncharacterized protein n=1 Tax=Seiridium unicorne TaxID=138068 RepID=A0ABR2V9S3_9PEZI
MDVGPGDQLAAAAAAVVITFAPSPVSSPVSSHLSCLDLACLAQPVAGSVLITCMPALSGLLAPQLPQIAHCYWSTDFTN